MGTEVKGIDVSKWQRAIDWNKVKAAGIKFAMVKLANGSATGNACSLDSYALGNINGALAAGLDVGVYLYSYATSVEAAQKEAAYLISKLAPYKGRLTYPVVYDLEDDNQKKLGTATLTGMADAFCSALEAAGYYAALYTNRDWLTYRLNAAKLAKYDLWLAQWGVNKPYRTCGMWQHSSTGTIAGISGNVDLNIAYKDYPQIIRAAGLNGFAKSGGQASFKLARYLQITPEQRKNRSYTNGQDVADLQRALIALGYQVGTHGADGVYGPDTEKAVIAFQRAKGLVDDGIVGPLTAKALGGIWIDN